MKKRNPLEKRVNLWAQRHNDLKKKIISWFFKLGQEEINPLKKRVSQLENQVLELEKKIGTNKK